MSTQLPGYAYNGYNLSNGGLAGAMHRADMREERRVAEVMAAQATIRADTRLAWADRCDLHTMLLFREITPADALAWAAELKEARPWYAR